jgi:hypothetical protein
MFKVLKNTYIYIYVINEQLSKVYALNTKVGKIKTKKKKECVIKDQSKEFYRLSLVWTLV